MNASATQHADRRPVRCRSAWGFVYVFFSNNTPYDAPNRSEPCSAI